MTRPGSLFLGALIAAGGLTGASPMICALPGVLVPAPQVSEPSRSDLDALIDRLGSFDVDRRIAASQAVRRAPGTVALPALVDAAAGHADGFVRARALVLLSGYDDPRVPDQMEQALADASDRLRAIAYQYFERRPDPRLAPVLIKALDTEVAEGARPSLVRALAAHGASTAVQRALLAQLARGPQRARAALVEALGDYQATYASKAIAVLAAADGPVQSEAIIAMGKIGGPAAVSVVKGVHGQAAAPVVLSAAAAGCLLGTDCPASRAALVSALTARDRLVGFEQQLRRAAGGLAALAARGDTESGTTLLDAGVAGDEATRDAVAPAVAALAARAPDVLVTLLAEYANRAGALDLLRDGFALRDEDFEQEQFFARLRAAHFAAPDGTPRRTLTQALINELEF
jgi:HEAT repeat protein